MQRSRVVAAICLDLPPFNRYPPTAMTNEPPKIESEVVELEPAQGFQDRGDRIPWILRGIMIFGGLILVTLLGIAASLRPSSDGFGTHRQIRLPFVQGGQEGLPACSFLVMFGKPCPSCGMTTSWAWLMRGNLWGSARANAGGMMLGLCALAAGPWLLISGLLGRFWPGVPNEIVVIVVGVGVVLATGINWIVRLF